MSTITLNNEQALYVIPSGNGYSCLGFQVCAERTNKLKREIESLASIGPTVRAEVESMPQLHASIEAYEQYRRLIDIARMINTATGYRFKCELSPQLTGLEGKRVEVIDFPGNKPRRFNVGRSTGFLPIHLEVARRNCHGGPAAMSKYHSVRVIR